MKTLSELIAHRGIDANREIRLLNARARYAMSRDRTKVYATTPAGSVPAFGVGVTVHTINADLMTLKLASDGLITSRDYVAAWCRLNHLKA